MNKKYTTKLETAYNDNDNDNDNNKDNACHWFDTFFL